MAARPLVGVQGTDGEPTGQTKLPAVFSCPIRPDVVGQVRLCSGLLTEFQVLGVVEVIRDVRRLFGYFMRGPRVHLPMIHQLKMWLLAQLKQAAPSFIG